MSVISDKEFYEKTVGYYLDLISSTADFLFLLSLLILADLSVQPVGQLRVVLRPVTVGSCRSELCITFREHKVSQSVSIMFFLIKL